MKFLLALAMAGQAMGPPAPPAPAEGPARVPMIGLEGPALDACGGIARIGTYDEDEPVLERPQDGAAKSDSLPHQTLVWLCEGAGEWQGIVYPSGDFQELGDCRVSAPIAESRPYDGPCRFGWVVAKHLTLVAG